MPRIAKVNVEASLTSIEEWNKNHPRGTISDIAHDAILEVYADLLSMRHARNVHLAANQLIERLSEARRLAKRACKDSATFSELVKVRGRLEPAQESDPPPPQELDPRLAQESDPDLQSVVEDPEFQWVGSPEFDYGVILPLSETMTARAEEFAASASVIMSMLREKLRVPISSSSGESDTFRTRLVRKLEQAGVEGPDIAAMIKDDWTDDDDTDERRRDRLMKSTKG